jgi:hypothetical protein
VDRYSFTVRLLHSHHLVDLSRRTGAQQRGASSVVEPGLREVLQRGLWYIVTGIVFLLRTGIGTG